MSREMIARGRRPLAWALCAAALLVALLGGPVLAATDGDEVTLPGGEKAVIVSEGSRVRVTLPGGVTVTRIDHGGGASSWGAAPGVSNADIDRAQEAYRIWVAAQPPPPRQRSIPIWFVLLLMGAGLLNLINPRLAWYLEVGWKLRDAEPSDAALGVNQLVGALMFGGGLILLLIG